MRFFKTTLEVQVLARKDAYHIYNQTQVTHAPEHHIADMIGLIFHCKATTNESDSSGKTFHISHDIVHHFQDINRIVSLFTEKLYLLTKSSLKEKLYLLKKPFLI